MTETAAEQFQVLQMPALPTDVKFDGMLYVDFIVCIHRNELHRIDDPVVNAIWVSLMASRRKRYERVMNFVSRALNEPLHSAVILIEQELEDEETPFVKLRMWKPDASNPDYYDQQESERMPYDIIGAKASEVIHAGIAPARPPLKKTVMREKSKAFALNNQRGLNTE